jgi:hypothetical protein
VSLVAGKIGGETHHGSPSDGSGAGGGGAKIGGAQGLYQAFFKSASDMALMPRQAGLGRIRPVANRRPNDLHLPVGLRDRPRQHGLEISGGHIWHEHPRSLIFPQPERRAKPAMSNATSESGGPVRRERTRQFVRWTTA